MLAFFVGLMTLALSLGPLAVYVYFVAPLIERVWSYGWRTSVTIKEAREGMLAEDWIGNGFGSLIILIAFFLLVVLVWTIGNGVLNALAARLS